MLGTQVHEDARRRDQLYDLAGGQGSLQMEAFASRRRRPWANRVIPMQLTVTSMGVYGCGLRSFLACRLAIFAAPEMVSLVGSIRGTRDGNVADLAVRNEQKESIT